MSSWMLAVCRRIRPWPWFAPSIVGLSLFVFGLCCKVNVVVLLVCEWQLQLQFSPYNRSGTHLGGGSKEQSDDRCFVE
jgi:hypothetical protein